ncbi:MAG: hypothetical protein GX295_06465 [Syntrophomonadaceae bacterium]|nr:hypothetical protein [Syntrophomonadaceae bacterium]
MSRRVGIPRALFYYYFYPQWSAFFQELGAEVVLSAPTHKGILEAGVRAAVDEACLPVKVFYGHVLELVPQVDYLFLPRLVSVEHKSYICPKFMGLPDMIKSNIRVLPPILDLCMDLSHNDRQYRRDLYRIGKIFTRNPWKIRQAERKSQQRLKEYQQLLHQGHLPVEALRLMDESIGRAKRLYETDKDAAVTVKDDQPGLTIGLLGHGYTLYDEFVSRQVIRKLRELGASVISQDILNETTIEEGNRHLPKRMFWTLGRRILGGAFHFFETGSVDGIIHLACFGCGPDSLVAELVEIEAHRRKDLPFMMLTVDEHTGEAGIVTRLEAFVDMIRRRQKYRRQLLLG